jgi:hypothetical protein
VLEQEYASLSFLHVYIVSFFSVTSETSEHPDIERRQRVKSGFFIDSLFIL